MTRDEAIQDLKDILEEATSDKGAVCYVTSEDAEAFDMAIEALQTCIDYGATWRIDFNNSITESTEVVRCKDCKHRYYADNRIPYERDWVCDWWGKDGCDEKGFCSYGERKESE